VRSALLFDLDGTLVDSHHEICLALAQALLDGGFQMSFSEVQQLVDGSPLEVIWHKVHGAPVEQNADAFLRFATSYRQHYMRDLGHASGLFPGVERTLATLCARLPATRLSVVSNKSASSVQPLLARFGIERWFALALGCGGTAIPAKPHPALLLHAAEQLEAAPDACVMIGDTVLDIEAGRRAGMRTVAVTHGMAARAELERAGADYLVDSFDELLDVLLR
jgi:phosphoglycolate phosphatase